MAAGPDRGSRTAPVVLLIVLLAALASACTTGRPTSTSAWQSATDRTLGTVLSSLGTARIAVVQDTRDHLPHPYAVVLVTDAVESSAKEIDGYLVSQPPDRLHAENEVVIAALQDAAALLVEVRVELASPGVDASAARALVARLDAMRHRIDSLDTAVTISPGSVVRS